MSFKAPFLDHTVALDAFTSHDERLTLSQTLSRLCRDKCILLLKHAAVSFLNMDTKVKTQSFLVETNKPFICESRLTFQVSCSVKQAIDHDAT